MTNVSFHNPDRCDMLVTSDVPADQRSRNQRSHILLTTHHTINPNVAALSQPVSRIRRPLPERRTLLCRTGRCICPIQRSITCKRPQQFAGAAVVGGTLSLKCIVFRPVGRKNAGALWATKNRSSIVNCQSTCTSVPLAIEPAGAHQQQRQCQHQHWPGVGQPVVQ